jgi:membrane-associated phospholipid phosphatase
MPLATPRAVAIRSYVADAAPSMFMTSLILLAVLTIIFLIIEMRGVRTTLQLSFKGDIKRESAFLAQYGQSVATPLAALFVAIAKGQDLFPLQFRWFTLVGGPVLMASLACMVLKRSLGRMRPNRENAGSFTGPAWRNSSKRESFPSSHSACAFALTMTLIEAWPQAAIVFWVLAFVTAVLRYLMDAHFPSDVIAGSLIGLVIGRFGFLWLDQVLPR